jgi:hypothetical protein
VAALLFPREDLFWVDRLAAWQTRGLKRLARGVIRPIPPRQLNRQDLEADFVPSGVSTSTVSRFL